MDPELQAQLDELNRLMVKAGLPAYDFSGPSPPYTAEDAEESRRVFRHSLDAFHADDLPDSFKGMYQEALQRWTAGVGREQAEAQAMMMVLDKMLDELIED